ncbi:MAG: methanogenesis marker 9 domain-containing protein [Methanocorpusculum parvum]|nr:methanogenesis marker 9 domain-containing protein [Methanocorpusculum parvum]
MAGNSRFISLLGKQLKTPIVLSSMAGITDAAYVIERAEHAGAAFIGGYSIDEAARNASKEIEACGRKEFEASFDDISTELAMLEDAGVVAGLNLRGSTKEAFLEAASVFGNDVIYEIDAHCRQPPMVNAGCGEALLKDTDRLCEIVSALAQAGYTVSVKTRAGITDDKALAKALWKAGAKIIHVDLMDFGASKLRQIRNSCPLVIIANNGVDSPDTMMEYFSHGADLVSLARRAEPAVLTLLDRYIRAIADEVGWYNAPKQLCRGGDYRSLAFCCMPIKQCALLPTLNTIGLEYGAYTQLKEDAVAGTPLAEGSHTCFGSLAFCCKSSTPCMFRDMTLKSIKLPKNEYMKLKRELSEVIMDEIFG